MPAHNPMVYEKWMTSNPADQNAKWHPGRASTEGCIHSHLGNQVGSSMESIRFPDPAVAELEVESAAQCPAPRLLLAGIRGAQVWFEAATPGGQFYRAAQAR